MIARVVIERGGATEGKHQFLFDSDPRLQFAARLGRKDSQNRGRASRPPQERVAADLAGDSQTGLGCWDATNLKLATRTWHKVMRDIIAAKVRPTLKRWQSANKDPARHFIKDKVIVPSLAGNFDTVLHAGTISTNVYLRRLQNHRLDRVWLPVPLSHQPLARSFGGTNSPPPFSAGEPYARSTRTARGADDIRQIQAGLGPFLFVTTTLACFGAAANDTTEQPRITTRIKRATPIWLVYWEFKCVCCDVLMEEVS